jgi:hypothetical protein
MYNKRYQYPLINQKINKGINMEMLGIEPRKLLYKGSMITISLHLLINQ